MVEHQLKIVDLYCFIVFFGEVFCESRFFECHFFLDQSSGMEEPAEGTT